MISVSDVCKIYPADDHTVRALDHVSLHIAAGELVAIVGESGSGKSTLMNILGCLDVPTSGAYSLCGREVQALSPDALSSIRGREIGFVFQGFHLLPQMTALENVALPLMYAHVAPEERRRRGEAALAQVGLSGRMGHRPSEMSGGQQQRVAIARALVTQPRLILADEPTGNLDRAAAQDVLELLCKLHEDGRTVVLITHDEKIAARAARAVYISNGKILKDTTL